MNSRFQSLKIFSKNEALKKSIFCVLAVLCITPLISSPLALALGFFLAIFIGNPFEKYLHKYIHLLLQVSIVGLGFGLQLNEAMRAGKTGFQLTIISIMIVMILGYVLGKILKIERPLFYLISTGTAICGGSAIAAVSPIIKPDTKQISVALAIVFTLNSVALFIYPSIGHLLHLSQEQFGLWCAIGIHDTSSVVGAANKYGNEALHVATTVKLARALWIIPVSIITMFIFKTKGSKIKIPWFIGLFVLAIIAGTYIPFMNTLGHYITYIAKSGLNLTLFFIGASLSLSTLKTINFKSLSFAVILWIIISVGSLLYIITYL
ncbi:putative sulfate exporter family transporter [Chryseobacterium sp.]|uniref:YeiH family protein n=1 Tax=Chryseobacterium sp. TaxID=1871047 RepID=UPI0025BBAD25|nr:putative sulfate exporter family transporter [Chryseobacterium sp.]